MIYAFVTIIAILAILLVLVVLAQDSKSGALSSNFGASQVMGVKRTSDLLEKLTWGFMIGIMVLSLSFKFITGGEGDAEGPNSINVERAKNQPAPQAPAPSQDLNPTSAPDSTTDTTKK